jgi:hypothetical protein
MYSFYFYAIKNAYCSLGGEINHILSRSKMSGGGRLIDFIFFLSDLIYKSK